MLINNYDGANSNSAIITTFLLLIFLTLSLIRYVFIVFSMWAFVIGMALAFLLISNTKTVPSILPLLQLSGGVKFGKCKRVSSPPQTPTKRIGCSVCGKRVCPRHRPEVASQTMMPWEGMSLAVPVDKALTEFLEITLETHLYSWYRNLTRDQGFVDEIRKKIRHIVAVLLQRVYKINKERFILKTCLKKYMVHLDCYNRVKERAQFGDDIQQLVFDKMKTYKHFATQSEEAETEYLRYLGHIFLTYLIPESDKESKIPMHFLEELFTGTLLKTSIEKAADPDFINLMLLILFDESSLPEPSYPPSQYVSLLESFGKPRAHHAISALNMSVYDLIHDSTLLYPFMQFMKREGSLNVLQFCLAVEEFNKKSLAPELSVKKQARMIEEAKEIYSMYFTKDAIDTISFKENIVKDFYDAISSPSDTMTRLKTAGPLFKAFEYAINLLESTFVPLFHQSDEFYDIVCGERSPKNCKNEPEQSLLKRKFMPLASLSKIANSIKVKKQSKSLDDRTYYDRSDAPEPSVELYETDSEDEYDQEVLSDEIRDLSYWHVTIPKVDHILEGNKKNYVFVIRVERVGGRNDEDDDRKWQVVRRYNEFYVLDNKLRRFHDSLNEADLPPKRTILKKDFLYLNSIRLKLQEYLQRLVRSPVLRGSSLLYSFLTPGAEITGMFEPDSVGKEAGRKIQSMKSKLVIERGQNLEPFLQAYLISAEPPLKKKISNRITWTPKQISHRTKSLTFLPPPQWANKRDYLSNLQELFIDMPITIADYIMYAARNLLKIPAWLHHILIGFSFLCKTTIDAYIQRFITYKMALVLAEDQMVNHIHLLRDAIFFENDPPRTDSDKVKRRDDTLLQMQRFFPKQVRQMLGPATHDQAMGTLLEIFQHPKLNKQMIYTLLDELMIEIFPELKDKEAATSSDSVVKKIGKGLKN